MCSHCLFPASSSARVFILDPSSRGCVPSCCDKSGTSCYHLDTRLMTLTDLLQVLPTRLKADFHSAENVARSTFSAHFLLNCSNQIQISEHISKENEREKSIARYFPLNGNPP